MPSPLPARSARPAAVALALSATCLLALSACGDDDPGESAPTAVPTIQTASPAGSPTPAPTTSAPSASSAAPTPAVRQITLTVANGEVTGDTGKVAVGKDEPFQVVVTSDVADEVHVHSETRAGFSADVEAGGTATIDAVIKVPGIYEIELEGRRLQLARVEVS